MLRPWYKITADPTVAELHIFDEIGKSFFNDDAVTAEQFLEDLAALPESVTTIRVLVNSPGGNPWEATTIANALRAQRLERGRTVEVQILGLAASAATIITSAGAPIRIATNAMLMVHNPSAIVLGDAREMTKMAAALTTVKDAIIATYRWVSKLSAEQLARLMDEETWMSAEMAVQNGLATEVMAAEPVEASFRPEVLARLGQVPDSYRERIAALVARPAPTPPTPAPGPAPAPVLDAKVVVQACTAAGFPALVAELLEAPSLDAVHARLAQAKAGRTEEERRALQIRGLCRDAALQDRAEAYIAAGVTVKYVQNDLTWITAKLAGAELDAGLPPELGQGAAAFSWAAAIAKASKR